MQFPQLHVGIGRQFGPFTIFPVWSDNRGNLALSTGTHAQLQVTELASGPEVNRLTVRNSGPKAALLIEGELLEGGHQHRVAAESLVLGPGDQTDVPVFCVEQGRWGGPSMQHGRRARRAPLLVRAELAGIGTALSDHNGSRPADQNRVWERVARLVGNRSQTGSLIDAYGADPIVPGMHPILPLEGQRGVVVGLAGQALTLELFGTSTLFARHWAHFADALRFEAQYALALPQRPTPGHAARDFVAALPAAPAKLKSGPVRHHHEFTTLPVRALAGRFAYSGLIAKRGGAHGQFAHLSVWDSAHPLVAV